MYKLFNSFYEIYDFLKLKLRFLVTILAILTFKPSVTINQYIAFLISEYFMRSLLLK